MKVKILGSVSPYSKGEKNCPGYLIYTENGKVLLDCGSGISRLMNFPDDLDNLTIIISHLHKDHYSELASIAYASFVYHNLGMLKSRINVYISEDVDSQDYKYLMNFGEEQYMTFHSYNEKSVISERGIKVSFKRTLHPGLTYAAQLKLTDGSNKKIHYSADTAFDVELRSFFFESDLLICESSLLEEQKNSKLQHLTAKEAGVLARISGAKKMILTHFWPEIDKKLYLCEAKQEFENTYVAGEGDIYEI